MLINNFWAGSTSTLPPLATNIQATFKFISLTKGVHNSKHNLFLLAKSIFPKNNTSPIFSLISIGKNITCTILGIRVILFVRTKLLTIVCILTFNLRVSATYLAENWHIDMKEITSMTIGAIRFWTLHQHKVSL